MDYANAIKYLKDNEHKLRTLYGSTEYENATMYYHAKLMDKEYRRFGGDGLSTSGNQLDYLVSNRNKLIKRYGKKQYNGAFKHYYKGYYGNLVDAEKEYKRISMPAQKYASELDSWVDEYQRFYETTTKRLNEITSSYQPKDSVESYVNNVNLQIKDLEKRASEIRKYFKDNSVDVDKLYGEGAATSVLESLNNSKQNFKMLRDAAIETSTKWSEFESEDDYKRYVAKQEADRAEYERQIEEQAAQAKEYEKLSKLHVPAALMQIQQLEEERNNLVEKQKQDNERRRKTGDILTPDATETNVQYSQRKQELDKKIDALKKDVKEADKIQIQLNYYNKLKENTDFEKYTKIGANIKNPVYGEKQEMKENEKEHYNLLIKNGMSIEAEEYKRNIENETQYWYGDGLNLDDSKIKNKVTYGREYPHANANYTQYKYLSDDEVNIYNYLLAKEGNKSADEYLESMSGELNAREMQDIVRQAAEQAEKDPVGATIGTVLTAPIRGFASLSALGQQIFTGEVDPNSPAFQMSKASQTIRGTVAKNIRGDNPTFWNEAAEFLYGAGTGVADFTLTTSLTGGLNVASAALISLDSATDSIVGALDRGVPSGDALMAGFANGAITAISLSALSKGLKAVYTTGVAPTGFKDSVKQLAETFVKSAGVGSGIGFGKKIAQNLADGIFSGKNSEFNILVKAYMRTGMSENDAILAVAADLFFMEPLSEAFQSGISAGVYGVIGKIKQWQYEKAHTYSGENYQEPDFETLAKELDPTTRKISALRAIMDDPSTTAGEKAAAENAISRILKRQSTTSLTADTKATQPQSSLYLTEGSIGQTDSAAVESIPQSGKVVKPPVATSEVADKQGIGIARYIDNEQGGVIEVKGLAAIENGNVYVKKADGSTAALGDIEFDDPTIDKLYENAKLFPTASAAQNYISHYDGKIPLQTYSAAYMQIFNASKNGKSVIQAYNNSILSTRLTEVQRHAAYAAGQNAIEELNKPKESNRTVKQPKYEAAIKAKEMSDGDRPAGGGVVRGYRQKLTQAQELHIKAVDVFGKGIKRAINIVDSIGVKDEKGKIELSQGNAFFDPKTNEYTIALDATGEAYLYIATHESVHDIALNNPEEFKKLAQVVVDILQGKGKDINELKAVLRENYKGADEKYLLEEIVANTIPSIRSDEETAKEFTERFASADEETRNLFEKILDTIKDLLKKIYNILKGQKSWGQMEDVENDMMALATMRDAYFDALEGRKEGGKGSVGSPRFSINPKFESDYNLWDKKNRSGYFVLGSPAKPLLDVGIPNKDIIMTKNDIVEKMKKHGLHEDVFRGLPNMINDPRLILRSITQPDSYLLYGELYDEQLRPIMAALKINETADGLIVSDLNRIMSAYARQKDGSNRV